MGKLIVFEGIDGVGKTTLSRALAARLTADGVTAVRYEDIEEKDTPLQRAKRSLGEAPIETSFYLYLASAVEKSARIEEILADTWVVCDRYIYSTYAHHAASGMDQSSMPPIASLPIRTPDHAFLVSIPEPLRIDRLSGRAHEAPEPVIPIDEDPLLREKKRIFSSFGLEQIDNSCSIAETIDSISVRVIQGA